MPSTPEGRTTAQLAAAVTKAAKEQAKQHMLGADFPALPFTVEGRWRLNRQLGQGSFGAVFGGLDQRTGLDVALKFESGAARRSLIRVEVALLRRLAGSQHVPAYVGQGEVAGCPFVAMELLADSLSAIYREHRLHAVRRDPDSRAHETAFSWAQTAYLGQQMLAAIRDVHCVGFLHRDIKPSNFSLGASLPKVACCYLLDFGLARRYLTKEGEVRRARSAAGFRGTARFASVHAHIGAELGRRDDLWSWWHILLEWTVGRLPWADVADRESIGLIKAQLLRESGLPGMLPLAAPLQSIMRYLLKLRYDQEPDYAALGEMLNQGAAGSEAGGSSVGRSLAVSEPRDPDAEGAEGGSSGGDAAADSTQGAAASSSSSSSSSASSSASSSEASSATAATAPPTPTPAIVPTPPPRTPTAPGSSVGSAGGFGARPNRMRWISESKALLDDM